MLALLSPSKTQDFSPGWKTPEVTLPPLLSESSSLITLLRTLDEDAIGTLMSISPKLAALNHERFRQFTTPFTEQNAKPAILAFRGDVYDGLDAPHMSQRELASAQRRIRILSGLYGLLRPLDLIQPYRLEMGTRLKNPRGKDLYSFWGERVTGQLHQEIAATRAKAVVNLASNEYFSAVNPAKLGVPLVTVHFRDWSGGKYKVVGLFAKRARGAMARYITTQNLDNPQDMIKFAADGYRFSKNDSGDGEYVFTRKKTNE